MFYCTRLQRFQEQIQQEEKDIWDSDSKDSVSVRSNASNQSEISIRSQSTLVPLPQKRSRGRPDEIKSQMKLNLNQKKKNKIKGTAAMRTFENLLVYRKTSWFSTIRSIKNVMIRMKNREHGNG